MATLSSLITAARIAVDDSVAPYLWSDTEMKAYANQAERAVCRIVRLLTDGTTSTETVATGTITLAGTAGQIDSVKVNGVTVTSGAVPFNSTLTQTATDLAANITAYASSPNYSAAGALAVVTVSAAAGSASTPNEYVITVTCSGGLSATVTNMTGGTALTRLAIIAGQQHYQLDPRIIDIEDRDVRLVTLQKVLPKCSYTEFQRRNTLWDTLSGEPGAFSLDWRRRWLTLDFIPTAADTAIARVIRLPLADMSADASTPEIPSEYHDFLPDMMAYFAFHKPDSETYNPDGIARYFALCFDEENPNSHIERIKRSENLNNRNSMNGSMTQMIHAGLL